MAVEAAGGWDWHEVAATDPIDRPVRARWLRSSDGRRAVVELAEASGLSRLTPEERDPTGASTFGTGAGPSRGDRLRGRGGHDRDRWKRHHRRRVRDPRGARRAERPGAGRLPASRPARLPRDVDVRVACDVTNPLLGERGAAATYGPQKGATPEQVCELDAHLERYADQLAAGVGGTSARRRARAPPAAWGSPCSSIQDRFRSFALRPGVDLVMELTDFDGKLGQADLVITGEGRIDAQTAFGKTALGVARAGIGRRACRALPSAAGSSPRGSRPSPSLARSRCRSSSGRSPSRRRWLPGSRRSSASVTVSHD